MTLWWIGNVVLLVVVLPVVVYLLKGVLDAATSIVPSVDRIAAAAAAGSKDLDAGALLLTTQDQVQRTVVRRVQVCELPDLGDQERLLVVRALAERERPGARH